MKHSFIALCILAATFTVTFVSCTKKDWFDETSSGPVRPIPAAKSDTPYGKINIPIHLPVVGGPGVKTIPVAKSDTPYGRINIPIPAIGEPGIRTIPAAKSDTPYGKINRRN